MKFWQFCNSYLTIIITVCSWSFDYFLPKVCVIIKLCTIFFFFFGSLCCKCTWQVCIMYTMIWRIFVAVKFFHYWNLVEYKEGLNAVQPNINFCLQSGCKIAAVLGLLYNALQDKTCSWLLVFGVIFKTISICTITYQIWQRTCKMSDLFCQSIAEIEQYFNFLKWLFSLKCLFSLVDVDAAMWS